MTRSRLDSFRAFDAFVRAAEARSFTAAGRQLGVSSSAVGKAIARLEETLNVRLLHRSTRTVTLTPEGTAFLVRCRRILDELDAAERELAQSRDAPRGRLRVSMPLAGMLMSPALAGFMAAYPEVELDVDFSDRLVDVVEEGFDAVVRAGEIADSRLMTRVLGTFRLMLVASPEYLENRGTPRAPADLQHHACLHHRFATSGKLERWPFRAGFEDVETLLPRTAVMNTIEPLVAMAECGRGITCLPDFAIRRQLDDGTLVAVLEDAVEHTGTFRILWPASRHVPPKLRVFVDVMADTLFR